MTFLKFVITLVHSLENCFAREENSKKGKQWAQHMREEANRLGVTIEGAYITPSEHTFYFILESDSLAKVSEFLGPPMLTLNSAKVAPVISVEEAFNLSYIKEKQKQEFLQKNAI